MLDCVFCWISQLHSWICFCLFSWAFWKYSQRSHYVRRVSATFTIPCYPILTLFVRKQMDSPYETFHQRPLIYPQAILPVYVKQQLQKRRDSSAFFFFLSFFPAFRQPSQENLRMCTHSHRPAIVRLLLPSYFVQFTDILCHPDGC